jgi:hypothetical protein
MIKSEYKINKRDFNKKRRSILKNKIIRTLKAYTLRDFSVDEENNTVKCKISVSKYGIVKELDKQYTVIYYTTDIPDNDLEVMLKLHATTV